MCSVGSLEPKLSSCDSKDFDQGGRLSLRGDFFFLYLHFDCTRLR